MIHKSTETRATTSEVREAIGICVNDSHINRDKGYYKRGEGGHRYQFE